MTSQDSKTFRDYMADLPKCKCEKPITEVRHYDPIWHDGEVWCKTCNSFVRTYDAG